MTSWQERLRARAGELTPAAVWDYVEHGSGQSLTRDEAAPAWSSLRLWPRVLRDVTDADLTVDLLGTPALPWGVAPTSLQVALHPEGDVAMARATAEAGGVMVVSSNTGTPFEDIAATGVTWWLQVYLPADRTLALPMLQRAVAAGASAVVLTVDTPVVASWDVAGDLVWDVVPPGSARANFPADHDSQPGSEKATDLGPQDVDWLLRRTGLPVVAKGVLRPDDALRCLQAGAAAVWVSTHGGRQLDRAVDTATAVRAVRAAVGESGTVYVDGGIRSGTDVVTAFAAGADAVFLGRLPLYGLVDGADGVAQVHRRLREETTEVLRLTGSRTPPDARGLLDPGL
ncbi:alpha-hydroxy acid oxidase [Nocardioides bruguierae]|uniref:Alpha-hydroxy-acid oxidizing protein n=1 Tax=Nocardioides bruguierae TaxID=2945102 RepID=A0A9X2DD51_9ACTN|nr:alpha-hydroxy acid oxidase [Nocardioides bruguierae]MCM0622289.1 alpha-hydroxy-acid oxidizing protein [Nocardioides bruguierae]